MEAKQSHMDILFWTSPALIKPGWLCP